MSARSEVAAQFEAEILAYIENDYDLKVNEKLQALKAIFDKYVIPVQTDLIVNKKEFLLITEKAASEYTKGMPEVKAMRRPLEHHETVNYALFKAFVGYLNSKNALLRVPQFKE